MFFSLSHSYPRISKRSPIGLLFFRCLYKYFFGVLLTGGGLHSSLLDFKALGYLTETLKTEGFLVTMEKADLVLLMLEF